VSDVALYTAIGQILSSRCLYRQLIDEENALLLEIYRFKLGWERHEVLTREYKVTYNEGTIYASMLTEGIFLNFNKNSGNIRQEHEKK
jgi:hypothetical protein